MYHNTNLNELNNRIDKLEQKFPRDNYAYSISRMTILKKTLSKNLCE